MIVEYHRPTTLHEAVALLNRTQPVTVPLAGGTLVNQPSPQEVAVVDLQALGLAKLERKGNSLELGCMLTLQSWLDALSAAAADQPAFAGAMQRVIEHEATYNLRQVATIAGTLVAADGRSPFGCAMLALDASLAIFPRDEQIDLGDLFPFRGERLRGKLITHVNVPFNVRLAYAYVARTPADQPLVCAALASWPAGRIRLALGGYGDAPRLAFDGGEATGLVAAAQSAYSQAGDAWASAQYRLEAAGALAKRCLVELGLEG
jgi:CO/xanthine dehydrogenase FAD-binding subunit